MILREEFQVHETLNPKLFDTTSQTLLPEVREKIRISATGKKASEQTKKKMSIRL